MIQEAKKAWYGEFCCQDLHVGRRALTPKDDVGPPYTCWGDMNENDPQR